MEWRRPFSPVFSQIISFSRPELLRRYSLYNNKRLEPHDKPGQPSIVYNIDNFLGIFGSLDTCTDKQGRIRNFNPLPNVFYE